VACANIAIAMAASVALADVLILRLLSGNLVARCSAGTMPSIGLKRQCVDIINVASPLCCSTSDEPSASDNSHLE
jgi:hypothetical protein